MIVQKKPTPYGVNTKSGNRPKELKTIIRALWYYRNIIYSKVLVSINEERELFSDLAEIDSLRKI